ncbi:MAG: ApaG domain, partial [Phycisphaerae bacterium]|nr:ApaG domain [Phycisphaerae bacterium]
VNEGDAPVTLRKRRWHIVDADGEVHDVEGEGVIGQQPTLSPGGKFEYQSYAPLMTRWGTMEGAFTFEREDRSNFDAAVTRFFLVGAESRKPELRRRS